MGFERGEEQQRLYCTPTSSTDEIDVCDTRVSKSARHGGIAYGCTYAGGAGVVAGAEVGNAEGPVRLWCLGGRCAAETTAAKARERETTDVLNFMSTEFHVRLGQQ